MFVPDAKHPIPDAKARVDFLLGDLSGSGTQIVIPTPAFSEILAVMGKARNDVIQKLTKEARFIIAPFDLRAAIELALMSDVAKKSGNKRGGLIAAWAKVKFDRQIVAISKVMGVTRIYSEDRDVKSIGTKEGVSVLGVSDIVVPKGTQLKLTPPGES
jgi:predicted nucleic acid-binding protein